MDHLWTLVLFLSQLVFVDAIRLYEKDSACGEVYAQLCPTGSKNEFSVVGCLLREMQSENSPVSFPLYTLIINIFHVCAFLCLFV